MRKRVTIELDVEDLRRILSGDLKGTRPNSPPLPCIRCIAGRDNYWRQLNEVLCEVLSHIQLEAIIERLEALPQPPMPPVQGE